jgi:aromatic ring-opening dioxygenase LigB subunit
MKSQFPDGNGSTPKGKLKNILAVLLLFVPWFLGVVDSKLSAAVILPHGDVALDPSNLSPGTDARKAGDEIAKGARQAAHWFATGNNAINSITSRQLDLIFLSTPHGIQLTSDYGIYLGPHASGSINITGDNSSLPHYTVTMPPITLDTSLSLDLVMELTSSNKSIPVEGIATSADGAKDLPLEWAEIIPLTFLPEPQRHAFRYIIWSYPLRRYTFSPEMVPELLDIGASIRDWMEALPLNIGVLISGDMSHTHQANGPYGYSNASAPFDKAVGHWASNPCDHAASLLQDARSLQPHGMSCGFTGMVLLHGMLCGNGGDHPYDSLARDKVYVNLNATYYGMMAATFDSTEGGLANGDDESMG